MRVRLMRTTTLRREQLDFEVDGGTNNPIIQAARIWGWGCRGRLVHETGL